MTAAATCHIHVMCDYVPVVVNTVSALFTKLS